MYQFFRRFLPTSNVQCISDGLEHPTMWYLFFDRFRQRIPDFELSTLVKVDVNKALTTDNCQLVCKGVWLAIEVARLKEARKCRRCQQDPMPRCYSETGRKEVNISGFCEFCFDRTTLSKKEYKVHQRVLKEEQGIIIPDWEAV